jgi:hypothetical protein
MTWEKFTPIIKQWLPAPVTARPYPNQRYTRPIQLRSPALDYGKLPISGSPARRDLRGGVSERALPTATSINKRFNKSTLLYNYFYELFNDIFT